MDAVGDHEFSAGLTFPDFTMEDFDLLWDESGAGDTPPDPYSSGHTGNHSVPAYVMDANAQFAADLGGESHLSPIQVPPDSIGLPISSFTGAGTEEMTQPVNATHTAAAAAAAVQDVPPVVNAGLGHQQPYLYSTGDASCCASTAAADTGSRSPGLDLEVKHGVGLPESGGGASAVRGSCKRKKHDYGSSSQRSTPPPYFNLVESEAGFVQSDPSFDDIKPPAGSTDVEIMIFLDSLKSSMPQGKEVNRSLAEQDESGPKAARSYVTTVDMMPGRTLLGYWKWKGIKIIENHTCFLGGVMNFQFHKNDGTKTDWFMHEYCTFGAWGLDFYAEDIKFRVIDHNEGGAEAPGEPTSPRVKTKNKVAAAAKKHRMRGPGDRVLTGESRAWQHFIKIYDKHPELEGSKVVYAVCCHCNGVLKAGTENGTKSLLTHCDSTCSVKNKNQQPRSSSGASSMFLLRIIRDASSWSVPHFGWVVPALRCDSLHLSCKAHSQKIIKVSHSSIYWRSRPSDGATLLSTYELSGWLHADAWAIWH